MLDADTAVDADTIVVADMVGAADTVVAADTIAAVTQLKPFWNTCISTGTAERASSNAARVSNRWHWKHDSVH